MFFVERNRTRIRASKSIVFVKKPEHKTLIDAATLLKDEVFNCIFDLKTVQDIF